jgi:predicted ATPase
VALLELNIAGYRSIRSLRLELGPLNVVVGPNGCGKTNLYRALYLLAAAASGRLAWTLAEEGGMPSALWAGKRKKEAVRMELGVVLEPLRYHLACGLPQSQMWATGQEPSHFMLDPEVKEERVSILDGGRVVALAERKGPTAFARDGEGRRVTYPAALRSAESLLSQLEDPHRYPTLSALRQELLAWRFYHHFRTDLEAPLRHPQVGIQTPVLSHDGRDLAAALETIREIGYLEELDAAVARAFPGARLHIESPAARFRVLLELPGLSRPLDAGELSDGTLRYLCLLAALMSPRPPPLLVLNEPETSLHSDLYLPLAELIASAARRSQLLVTTHSEALADEIARHAKDVRRVRLTKEGGETREA